MLQPTQPALQNTESNLSISHGEGVKIRVLQGLAGCIVGDRAYRKSIPVFIRLKYLYQTGSIFDYTKRMEFLAQLCGISERSLYTRLNELKKLKLITINHSSKTLNFVKWETLYDLLGLHESAGYNYIRVPDGIPVELLFRRLAIFELHQVQNQAIYRKLKRRDRGSEVSIPFEERKKLEIDRLLWHFKMNVPLPEDEDVPINTDTHVSLRRIADLFGLKSQTSGIYWQRRLVKYSLIRVENRLVVSLKRCRQSILGHVFYSRKTKETLLQLPNSIYFS